MRRDASGRRRLRATVILLLFVCAVHVALTLAAARTATDAADVVFRNGRFYTLAGPLPGDVAEEPHVDAVAARNGRIVALGSWQDVQPHVDADTRVVDVQGATAVPGLVDAHAHMRNLGRWLNSVDLVGTRSYAEVITRVEAAARQRPAGTWIRGRGWDQNDWEDTGFPDHAALTAAVPDHPVWIQRIDGHAGLGNALALEHAGISAATQAPAGGRILRRADGTPTGVLVDKAEELVTRVLPVADLDTQVLWFRSAMQHMLQRGLVGMHDAGVGADQLAAYRWLLARGELDVRIHAMVDARPDTEDTQALAATLERGPETWDARGRLAVRCVKFAMDGALGSRGAALLEPYSDETTTHGLPQYSPEELRPLFLQAHRAGFQIAVHAIGDAANRACLDVLASIQEEVPRPDARHRIEHAQIVSSADMPRFAVLGVVPSMQPTHCTSDMPWAPRRLGPDRLDGAYAWRSLRDTGVLIPAGSDAPVESIDPLRGIHAAVTRQGADGQPAGGWSPEQCLSRSEALRAFTLWPAWAAFAENDLGSLEVGKWLDLSIFDRDIVHCEARELLETGVRMTVVGGTIVYEAP